MAGLEKRRFRNYLLIEILWRAICGRRTKEYYGSSFVLIRPSGDGNTAILRITYARSELWKQLIWTSSRYNTENRYVRYARALFPAVRYTRSVATCTRGDLSMDRLSVLFSGRCRFVQKKRETPSISRIYEEGSSVNNTRLKSRLVPPRRTISGVEVIWML